MEGCQGGAGLLLLASNRLEALRAVLRDEGARADSHTLAQWLNAELEARRSIR